jgi:O-antigen ligase
MVASGVATGFALMQWYARDFKADVSISAMLGNPNLLASYLLFSVPLVVGWVMQTRPAHPADATKAAAKIIGGVVVMFGILIALRNTDSRAAWGALGVTAAIGAAGWLAMKNPKRAWMIALGFVGGTLILAAVTQPLWKKAFAEDVRVEIWRGTMSLIRAQPITGTGAGTFFAEYPPHRTAEYFAKPKAALVTDHAHNEWLETWAEWGTLGVVALLAVWLYAAHQWWHRRNEMRAENWAFAFGAIALMAHGTFEVSLRHPPSQFLVWLALGLSLSGLSLPRWNWKLAEGIRHSVAGAAILACVAAAYYFVGKPLQSDIHWRRANVLLDADKDGAELELSAAIDAQPFRVEAIYRRAALLEKQLAAAQDDESRARIEILIERDLLRIAALAPHHRGVNRRLGLLYCRRGDFGRAIPYLETEVSLNKGTPSVPAIAAEFASDQVWLARAYLGAARISDAKESLRKAERLDPNNESVKEMLKKLGE